MTKQQILDAIAQCAFELDNGTLTLDEFFDRMYQLNEEWTVRDEDEDEFKCPPERSQDEAIRSMLDGPFASRSEAKRVTCLKNEAGKGKLPH